MEITLTKRWTTRHYDVTTKEITEGDEIEYYGKDNKSIDDPYEGVVYKDEKGLYIKWNDTNSDTRIDNSSHSNDVLSNCGFAD